MFKQCHLNHRDCGTTNEQCYICKKYCCRARTRCQIEECVNCYKNFCGDCSVYYCSNVCPDCIFLANKKLS